MLLAVLFVVLFVVLVRKGASAGKAVLWVAGARVLLLAIAFAVIFAVRSISRDFIALVS